MLRLTFFLTLLWLPTALFGLVDGSGDFFYWRHQFIMLTGLLALGYMASAVLLAGRFRWLEDKLGGLDKGYALHKQLGIASLLALVSHWLMVKSAKWMVQAGLLMRPGGGPHGADDGFSWVHLAKELGDPAFKLFVIFAVISLVQAISYKKFRFTHKLGGIIMLVGVFHTLFLLDWSWASLPMNGAAIAMCIAATACSLLSLCGRIGKRNKVSGEVSRVDRLLTEDTRIVRVTARLDDELDYREGQFCFVDFHDGEAPHPFSVLDYHQGEIVFGIKALGDYTSELVRKLERGQKITVEGGYGRFQVSGTAKQVWVGAGIGIVPFLSRLYWLQRTSPDKQPQQIHLFYTVNRFTEAFFYKELQALSEKLTGVELHLLVAEDGQILKAEEIARLMESEPYEVSFCGPEGFREALKKGLGLPKERFHYECFNMR